MSPDTPAVVPAAPTKNTPVDPAFRTIVKGNAAFLIWRVEKLHLVPLPKEQYGSFYNGDSYIIYSASDSSDIPGVNIKSRELRGQPDLRIHFWLGEQTSQDEAGIAAIKTVELDDQLGGHPIQHREVQGSESDRFKSYFPSGIRYLEGGVASGLNALDTTFKTKLFHIKGKRRPIIREMREISWSSMNDGDVFVLDTAGYIFVWNGKNANNYEKMQGSKVAQKLRSEHGGGSIVVVDDGQESALHADEKQAFSEYLDLNNKTLKPAGDATDDDDTKFERVSAEQLKLYRCTDAHGVFKMTEVKNGPLRQTDLDSNDSFIIDNHTNGVWVWIGKKATSVERTEAMRNAQGFVSKKGYPKGTPIVRVIDGGEPVEFKGFFKTWQEPNQSLGPGKIHSYNKIAQTVQTKFDAATLHENRALAAECQMVDDGSGQTEIWRVENFDLKPIDRKYYGAFYGGDCYVILYTYLNGTTKNYLLYYWIGRKSTPDEQGTAALKTIEMDHKLGGQPVQIRVVQGKEPPHFMAMFGGRLAIFEGGKASGFANADQKEEQATTKDSYLLHVRGFSQYNTKAVEVPKRASSLNSNDVFVLFAKTAVYLWAGKGSTGDEREAAKRIASASPREPITVFEGNERQDFWDALGGKEPYSSEKRLQEVQPDRTPRLFQCSNASGRFKVEETIDFSQDDLVPDDVMLLDTGDAVCLWVGNGANAEEKSKAEGIAKEYLRTDPKGRDESTPIIRVKQGREPPTFTGFFGVWDNNLWTLQNGESKNETEERLASVNGNRQMTSQKSVNGIAKYPLNLLMVNDPEGLPEGVDPMSKEVYLDDQDFQTVFRMPYKQFCVLPAWKKNALKKSAGLF